MMGGGGQQQLQALSQELQAIEAEIQQLEAEIESLRGEKREMDEATEAIDLLETGSTVQVPLGGGAYVRAEVEDIDEIIVELGGNYAAEREQDEAVETLGTKQELLDDRIEDVQEEIQDLREESSQLEQQAQQMQQQLQQQQMQQMQGMQGGDGDDE